MRRRPSADLAWILGCLAVPWALFGWMVFGRSTIGQDYVNHQVLHALTYRFYPTLGIEPLWSMFTGGIPVGGLALAQAFHFPAWLLSRLPGYWTGQALTLLAIKHLILLGVAHLAGYGFLRRLTALSPSASFLLSLAFLYQLRTLDSLRYGTALDAFVYGHCGLLLSLLYLQEGSKRWLLLLPVLVQLFITAGYPPMLPMLGLAALIAWILHLLYLRAPRAPVLARTGHLLGASAIGVLLAAPNWLPFLEWLQVNDRRVRQADLAWANYEPLRGSSLWANLFQPWQAEVHSGFAGTTLFVLLLCALLLEALRRPRYAGVAVALALPLAYAFGGDSLMFRAFFELVPGFSSLRAPGRITVALAPLLLVATAAIWGRSAAEAGACRRPFRVAALVAAAGLSWTIVLVAGASLGAKGMVPIYSPESLASSYWSAAPKLGWTILGLVTCALVGWGNLRRPAVGAALIATTVGQAAIVLPQGTWVSARPRTPTWAEFAGANHLPFYASAPLRTDSHLLLEHGPGTATTAYTTFIKSAGPAANCFLPVHAEGMREPVILPFYLSAPSCVSDAQALWDEIRRPCPDGSLRTLVAGSGCDGGLNRLHPAELARLNSALELTALTPNLVAFEADVGVAAVLVTPYPAVEGWKAWVDDAAAAPLQVNGAFVGVTVPPGRHRVKVAYVSRYVVAAYRLWFGTLIAIGLSAVVVMLKARVRPRLVLLATVAMILMAGGGWVHERRLRANILREITLENNYRELMAEQLARWAEATRNGTPARP